MFCSFNSFFIASCPVNFMSNGKKVHLKGRFPLRNPWWKISCSAKQYTHKCVATGFPSYELRTDLKNDWRAIISLFLKECDVENNFVVRFMEWLPKDRYVDLRNLDEALSEFGESSSEANQASGYVRSQIYKSGISNMLKCLFSSMMQSFFPCNLCVFIHLRP